MYILDTNIFSDITRDASTVGNFIDLIKESGKHVNVPWIVLSESMEPTDDRSKGFIRKRFLQLSNIMEALGPDRISLGWNVESILKKEFKRKGCIRSLPCDSPGKNRDFINGVRDEKFFAHNVELNRERMIIQRKQKEIMSEGDRMARELKTPDGLHDHLIEFLENWRGPLWPTKQNIDFVLKGVRSVVGPSRSYIRRVFVTRDGYFFSRALFTMVLYRFFWRRVDRDRLPMSVRKNLKPLLDAGWGDWFDHNIAAYGAFGGTLVTKDVGLKAFCEFMRERNVMDIKTMSWDEFESNKGVQ